MQSTAPKWNIRLLIILQRVRWNSTSEFNCRFRLEDRVQHHKLGIFLLPLDIHFYRYCSLCGLYTYIGHRKLIESGERGKPVLPSFLFRAFLYLYVALNLYLLILSIYFYNCIFYIIYHFILSYTFLYIKSLLYLYIFALLGS